MWSVTFGLLLDATASTPSAAADTTSGVSPETSTAAAMSGARTFRARRSLALSNGRTSSSNSSSASSRSRTDLVGSANIPVACWMNCCSVGFAESNASASFTSARLASSSACVGCFFGGRVALVLGDSVGDGTDAAPSPSPSPSLSPTPTAPPPIFVSSAISRSRAGSEFSIAQLNKLCMCSSGTACSSASSDDAEAAGRG
mmetsp:Transcript_7835/g.29378  ORF Transcript_7835/g.29378 Transcript_7835/m.29378 type:complete len:201 (-) Transcript_7835:147-749(-)